MLAHLQAFFVGQEPEELHRFRVQVKKINALLFFLQNIENNQKRFDRLQPLRAVFQHAGLIRGAYIHLGLTEQYQVSDEDYRKIQEKIVCKETILFCVKRDFYTKNITKLYKNIFENFENIENEFILRLYKRRLDRLRRFFAKRESSAGKLHKKRKEIKRLLYLRQALPRSLVRELRLDATRLDELQEVLGKWRDVAILKDQLKAAGLTDKKNLEKIERRNRRLLASVWLLADDFVVRPRAAQ